MAWVKPTSGMMPSVRASATQYAISLSSSLTRFVEFLSDFSVARGAFRAMGQPNRPRSVAIVDCVAQRSLVVRGATPSQRCATRSCAESVSATAWRGAPALLLVLLGLQLLFCLLLIDARSGARFGVSTSRA